MTIGRYLWSAFLIAALAPGHARAQELVITTVRGAAPPLPLTPTIIIPDLAASLPYPVQLIVAPQPGNAFPPPESAHGLALFAPDRALTSHVRTNEIHVIDTANAAIVSEFILPGFNGFGTLAVNPAGTKLFAFTGDVTGGNQLQIVDAPFSASSPIATLDMPGNGGTANARAIAFDAATGRAFVGHSTGVSAIDPPYTSIAFTIPVAGVDDLRLGQVVALSPDGEILATTAAGTGLNIVHAPFGPTSTPVVLNPPGAHALDGLAFTPDAGKIIVVDAMSGDSVARAFAISAPFDAGAQMEALPLDDDLVSSGLEDVDISADGHYAVLTGNDADTGQPLIVIEAPFTAAGMTVYPIHIPLMPDYTPHGGRGAGTARFWPTALSAPPQFSPDARFFFALEGDSGTSPLRIDVHLSHPSNHVVTIDYATVDGGGAVAGVNYIAQSGTLSFAPGETRKHFSVDVIGNTTGDLNSHIFDVHFTNPVNASISSSLASIRCAIADEENGFHYGVMTTPDHLPDGRLGAPYSLTLTTTFAGDAVWRVLQGELPPGLTLNETTGQITGTPSYPGTYWMVVNSAHTPGGYFNLTVPRPGDVIFADGFEPGAFTP